MRTPTDHLSRETTIISENDRKKKTKGSAHCLKGIQQMEKHLFKPTKSQ